MTALQETKWFGSEMLTYGREKPVQGDTVKLEGSKAMEGMELQSSLSMSTVGWEI